MKRVVLLSLVLVLVLSLFTGCGKKAETYELKVSTVLADTDPIVVGLE